MSDNWTEKNALLLGTEKNRDIKKKASDSSQSLKCQVYFGIATIVYQHRSGCAAQVLINLVKKWMLETQ